jgi:hypothetical protein
MSGSKENATSGAPDKRGEVILNLSTVQRMLPLVEKIVQDILASQKSVEVLTPEQDRLSRQKRTLDWPQRQRRYQIDDELQAHDRQFQDAVLELQGLGVELLEGEIGRDGFPTLVNNRRSYFSWKPGDEGLKFWHFAEEDNRRPIPASWLQEIQQAAKN